MSGEITAEQAGVLAAQLEELLGEVRTLLARFEASGMDAALAEDYARLQRIQADATAQRQQHLEQARNLLVH